MAGAIADLIEPGRQDLEAAAELPSGLAAAIGRDRGRLAPRIWPRRSARATPEAGIRVSAGQGFLAHFVSHSPPSGAVHERPRAVGPRWSGTLAAGDGRWCAVLESV